MHINEKHTLCIENAMHNKLILKMIAKLIHSCVCAVSQGMKNATSAFFKPDQIICDHNRSASGQPTQISRRCLPQQGGAPANCSIACTLCLRGRKPTISSKMYSEKEEEDISPDRHNSVDGCKAFAWQCYISA